ncbi:hypothetical protein [Gordonia sp. AC31]|nr:hypothetical protein [Gordonia sp. AC31]MDT0222922.1 hypothetical protein [Gordonia sp. AC31]
MSQPAQQSGQGQRPGQQQPAQPRQRRRRRVWNRQQHRWVWAWF